tara:strand:+ start:569 stop:1072 length:504 start_codon:yes stop_codon:yes gene_type:complete
MKERTVLQPPEIIETGSPVIFLAGPIQGAPDWQTPAAGFIHDIDPTIVVASPRKDYLEGTFVYEKQVDWETHFLRAAGHRGVVAFWLAAQVEDTPGRSYAQTTRFELAEWKMRHEYEGANLTVGIEEGFGNARYIRRRFGQDAPNVRIADSIEEMAQNAIDLVWFNT